MNGILDGVKSLFGCALHRLESDIKRTLNGTGLSDDQLGAVSAVFSEAANPFESLDTKYKMDRYIQDNLPFLVRSGIFWVIYIFFTHPSRNRLKECLVDTM